MKRGDVYWISLKPTEGREIRGKGPEETRPCVILSPEKISKFVKVVTIAPLTSKIKQWPWRPNVVVKGKNGQVVIEQLRSCDINSIRFKGKMGSLTKEHLEECLLQIRNFFT